ncbi:MAG: hypothetical protein AB8B43_08975, partial [Prochlorococcus sp.]
LPPKPLLRPKKEKEIIRVPYSLQLLFANSLNAQYPPTAMIAKGTSALRIERTTKSINEKAPNLLTRAFDSSLNASQRSIRDMELDYLLIF